MRKRLPRIAALGLVALAAASWDAGAQARSVYAPSTRVRLPAEAGCMKDEVVNGVACVKKCQADFRLDLESKPPVCIATKAEAKYDPPKPEFTTLSKPPASGAKGY